MDFVQLYLSKYIYIFSNWTVWSWSVWFQTELKYSLVIHSKKEKKIPIWESPLYFIVMERPILLIGYNFCIDYLTSSSLATLLLCFYAQSSNLVKCTSFANF